MKYAIFSDIDGTIYPFSKKIHPQTISDINQAQKLGVEFIFATGNGFFYNIRKLAKQFNCRYIITSNGATIWDLTKQKIIYSQKIPHKLAQEILAFGNKHQMTSSWWDDHKAYYNEYRNSEMAKIIANVMTSDLNEIAKDEKITNDIYKLEFFDSPSNIKRIIDFTKNMPLQIALIDDNHVEITHLNVSKGEAVKWMSKQLKFDLTHTMSIGDSTNDVSMLATTKHAYAMANATSNVKEKSNHHTSSVEQNGLGEAIQDFIYREKIGA